LGGPEEEQKVPIKFFTSKKKLKKKEFSGNEKFSHNK